MTSFETLYNNPQAARRRAEALAQNLPRGSSYPVRFFSAPGRTELGGNHTDHNNGKVIAAAVNLDSLAAVLQHDERCVIFHSTGYPEVVVDLNHLEPDSAEEGTTEALIRGIAAAFEAGGTPVSGWQAYADSQVPGGSGLSSSAVVEVLIGRIFDNLYGKAARSALEIAQIGQKAENQYFGKPSGLMDQAACACGGVVLIDFADPLHALLEPVPFDLSEAGLSLCIVRTSGNHADLTPDYAAISHEMKAVAAFFGKKVLQELTAPQILARAKELSAHLGDRAVLRALHFFNENKRVEAMKEALNRRDMSRYLALVNESGDSSWELLQNVSSSAHPASKQSIALALALTRQFLGAGSAGACRVHGGGFAGTIQTYLPSKQVPAYREYMDALFGAGAVTELKIRRWGVVELQG
ncbi:MAG: galactokinase [Spirochaetaceae bacterium]|jgi:galactokinase|nr:galactokinase [Spirochaetaceae bacterium]